MAEAPPETAAAAAETADEAVEAHRLLLDWYARAARDLPWRGSRDPYAILVSEIMLQQTQVERVTPKYAEFLALFPDLASLARAAPAEVIRAWSGLGYNRRAVNLQRLARVVVDQHDGQLPEDVKALRALPGLGRYTAAAVACFAFGRREPVVDTNVRRVLARLAGRAAEESTVKASEAERLALRYLPAERAGDWSQALMDLGATICHAASPRCLLCPLRDLCPSRGAIVREPRARYTTARAEPFRASNRYLRGRIIALLRELPPFASLPIAEIAQRLRLTDDERAARLARLLGDLERDGLVVYEASDRSRVRLPD
jgi:A/G-specific adenine glycosylase